MEAAAVSVGQSWMWTLAFEYHEDRTPTHGHEPTREAAMAAFREELVTEVRYVGFWAPRIMRPTGEPIQRDLSDQSQAVFGSIHRTCLSVLVTDHPMEAWYHRSIA
jgi:hypothetical protein